jgi:hypothetical protein
LFSHSKSDWLVSSLFSRGDRTTSAYFTQIGVDIRNAVLSNVDKRRQWSLLFLRGISMRRSALIIVILAVLGLVGRASGYNHLYSYIYYGYHNVEQDYTRFFIYKSDGSLCGVAELRDSSTVAPLTEAARTIWLNLLTAKPRWGRQHPGEYWTGAPSDTGECDESLADLFSFKIRY